jgi:geranylgeranyl diphosphate synthase, type II
MNLEKFSFKYKPIIEQKIQSYFEYGLSDKRRILQEAMLYSLMSKAKRIRPLLVVASFLLFEKEENISKILPLAVVTEIVHTYSLIHDDLPAMDNDDYRRGRLTCHKKYGEDIAVLAGDTLNTFAFELLVQEMQKYYAAEKVLGGIQKFARNLGIFGMAGGQALDLKVVSTDFGEENLRKIHSLKTGALLRFCVEVPAYLLDASREDQNNLAAFGEHLGLLFQIVDDILDVEGSKQDLGKSLHKDAEQNKLTYVALFGLAGAKEKAKEEYALALDNLKALENEKTTLLADFLTYVLKRNK